MVVVCADFAKKITFATTQNHAAILHALSVRNDGPDDLNDLVLTCETEPPFLQPMRWPIDRIVAGGEALITNRDLRGDRERLFALTERIAFDVVLTLRQCEAVLAAERYDMTALARHEWGGAHHMPEMLAAFVMPNDPATARVLKDASELLARSGKRDALDGYQSKSRTRSWELAAAIWGAVSARRFAYAVPPASFETQGQKVRTPGEIAEQGLATCLDTTLLFAAALEGAGLYPIIAFTQGHACCGCWLQPQHLPGLTTEDPAELRKAIALNELILFETTLATGTAPAPFAQALKEANRLIAEEAEAAFVYALDVKEARGRGITPIPEIAVSTVAREGGEAPPASVALPDPPDLGAFENLIDLAVPDTPAERVELWKRRLLDLTRVNRLLNVKPSLGAIPIFCPDPAALEDRLAEGRKLRIITPVAPSDGEGAPDPALFRLRTGDERHVRFAADALDRDQIVATIPPKDLDKGLVQLYRKARAEQEEGGSNTLFLALGMLRWRPKGQPAGVTARAPLILAPVKLTRGSALVKPVLQKHDDDTVFNLTLLELLRQDFDLHIPELADGLPEDEAGVDVARTWDIVRQRVRDIPGFEVLEEVVLSTFSFAKYLMWKDLSDRTEQLKESPFVRHLIDNPHDPFPHGAQFISPESIDRTIDPADLFMPLNADSSQIVAVHASAAGGDFVLEGPPGTGKSETIGNIIAHNLALGRKVLFVSEKMAALDVVYRRLQDHGLGDFCLEAHSSKASKQGVISQLSAAWEQRGQESAEVWTAKAEDLKALRDELNGLVKALHSPGPSGLSPRQAIGRAVRHGDELTVDLGWGAALADDRAGTPEGLAALRQAAAALGLAFADLRPGDREAFQGVGHEAWSNGWTAALTAAARDLLNAIQALADEGRAFADQTGLKPPGPALGDWRALQALAEAIPLAARADVGFALTPDGQASVEIARDAAGQLMAYAARRGDLMQAYPDPDVDQAPIAAWRSELAAAERKFWPIGLLARRRLAGAVRRHFGVAGPLDLAHDLPVLADLHARARALEARAAAAAALPPAWRGRATDPAILTEQADAGAAARAAFLALAGMGDDPGALRETLRLRLVDNRDLLAAGGAIAERAAAFQAAFARFEAALGAFQDLAGWSGDAPSLKAIAESAGAVIAQAPRLRDWCAWVEARRIAEDAGLGALAAGLDAGLIAPGDARAAFDTAYAGWLAPKLIDERPALRRFSKQLHEDRIAAFRALDAEVAGLTSAYIRVRLSGAIPSPQAKDAGPGFSVLAREMRKKARHMPVRRLMSEMGDTLFRLTPCVLMSPLSVAQFLPADQALFDLVIFDEASQITVWDAIGAIARGRNVIVVGDPKQMPPTNFFNKAAADDDLESDTADLESILDEAMGTRVPHHRLTGHYRSRHESLIAFSNHAYYDSRLITFPSAETRASAVSFRRVKGVYAKGAARTNPIEAQAVVDEAARRLADPGLSALSIGIVTLNAEQQRLIEDKLDELRRSRPEFEPYFNGQAGEPVFVKNLETVQGDQRDVILISIGYGPTAPDSPAMSMNFGPLNRMGGERRLNVAITRATTEVILFASFDAAMIDLSRTQAAAVRDLKTYIDFAERGPVALGQAIALAAGDSYDSDFEFVVAEGLRRRGWDIRTQVGVSKFRIDLGVVHPDAPGRFLAGIECDGAAYHASPTARDRDRVRQAILEALGWRLRRIWSTHYFREPEAVLDDVDGALIDLLADDRQAAAEAPPEPDLPPPPPTADPVDPAPEAQAEPPLAAPEPAVGAAATAPAPADLFPKSDASAFPPMPDADGGRFYDGDYNRTLAAIATGLIDREGPVTFKALSDRIARLHGFQRTGSEIKKRVWRVVERARRHVPTPDGHKVFWPKDVPPAASFPFRGPAIDGQMRAWADVAYPERRAAVAAAMAADGEAFHGAIARQMGLTRVGAGMRADLDAIADAIRNPDGG